MSSNDPCMPGSPALTAAELAAFFASGEADILVTTQRVLDSILSRDDVLHAFVDIDPAGVLAIAAERREEFRSGRRRSALHGIPVAIKDLFDVAGRPTACGSRARAGRVAAADATVVARLRAAGAIIIGKTHSYEFAFGGLDTDPAVPSPRNPWNLDRWTGASSSGSAAAVAAGWVPIAIGSDTAGSIRAPAAFCGLTGFKTTFGALPLDGVQPLAPSLDTCGIIATSAADALACLDVLAGRPAHVPAGTADLAGLRVGVARDSFVAPLTAVCIDAGLTAADVFRGLGATLVDVRLPSVGDFHRACFSLLIEEARAIHAATLATERSLLGASFVERLDAGGARLGLAPGEAEAMRQDLRAALAHAFGSLDLLVLPSTSGPAPAFSQLSVLGFLDSPQYTTLASLAGLPALSTCVGFTDDGLPLGVQLVGRAGTDRFLLQVAGALEAATPGFRRVAMPAAAV